MNTNYKTKDDSKVYRQKSLRYANEYKDGNERHVKEKTEMKRKCENVMGGELNDACESETEPRQTDVKRRIMGIKREDSMRSTKTKTMVEKRSHHYETYSQMEEQKEKVHYLLTKS